MSPATVVVLGAGGQLGRTLVDMWRLADTGSLPRVHAFDRKALDISDYGSLVSALAGLQPDWVINCAAYTRVDQAESEQNLAYAINGQGAGNVARWAADQGARLLHVSTDFVFNGFAGRPYTPDAEPDPLGVYGASKLQGEQAVSRIFGRHALILRTGWVYSALGSNFLLTILRLLGEREQLKVVADQVGTPTSTWSLATLIRVMVNSGESGLFHWTDAGVASWYDFAVAIQEEALLLGLVNREIPIHPIRTDEYPTAARRPSYSVLDKSSTCATFGCEPVHWRRQLRVVMQELKSAPAKP